MTYLTKEDKNSFGVFPDRKNSFDDENEIEKFIIFAKKFYKSSEYELKPKPFGPYGVDIGIYKNGELISTVDVERWREWKSDWPPHYKYISFLGRKEKFLNLPGDFVMAYFNESLDKILVVSKKDIIKYPTQKKFFQRFQKYDLIRQIPFDCGRLYGSNLTENEKNKFKNNSDYEIE
jgi:hypothetical protein